MAQKRKSGKSALDAALGLAARKGWNRVTMADIARAAPADAKKYKDKLAILHALIDRLDDRTLAEDTGAETRDALFDLFMARFDALNENRLGWLSILKTGFGDAPALLPRLYRSMEKIAHQAGLERACAPFALGAIYLSAIYTWKDDESADLGKTMAALDKRLTQAGRLLDF